MQISAKGMDPADVEGRFGDKLVFWGGAIDAQHVLPRGTPEEVRRHVRENMASLEARRRLHIQQRAQHPGRRARRRTSWPCSTRRTSMDFIDIPLTVAVVSFNPEPAATVAPFATPSPLAPG